MPQISCAALIISTCEATIEGATGRDALLDYIATPTASTAMRPFPSTRH